MKPRTIFMCVCVLMGACSKKSEEDTEAKPESSTDEPAPKAIEPSAHPRSMKAGAMATGTDGKDRPGMPDAFATWDMPARQEAFQGAHVMPGPLNTWEAWKVEGESATVWDGKAEKTYEFALTSPCTVALTRSVGGGFRSTTYHYTMMDGDIRLGPGDAGSRRGKSAVACIDNAIFTLDESGTCLKWTEDMFEKGVFKSEPGTCTWDESEGKEVFSASVRGREEMLYVEGNALLSEEMQRKVSKPATDFAEAKATRDEKAR